MKRLFWMAAVLAVIGSLILASGVLAAAGGTATIRDDKAQSDKIVIALTGLPAVAGKTLVGWLVSDDGKTFVNTGVLTPDGSGNINATYTSPTGQNIAGLYNKFIVSAEDPSNAAATAPAGQVVAEAINAAPEALMHVRHDIYQWDAAPNKTGLTVGTLSQAKLLSQHAHLLQDAVKAGNLDMAKLHAEHVVNIVEGSKGADYGDLNKNGKTDNPGDGFGVLEYAKQGAQHAGFAASTADANDYVKLHSMHVVDTSNNVIDWATQAKDAALKVLAAADIAAASPFADTAVKNADLALNGNSTKPVKGEGGATTAYEHAQNMASFTVGATNPAPAPAPTGTAAMVMTPAPAVTTTVTVTGTPTVAATRVVTATVTPVPAPATSLPKSGGRTPVELFILAGFGAVALGLGMRRFGVGRSSK